MKCKITRSGSIVIIANNPPELHYESGKLVGITHLVLKGILIPEYLEHLGVNMADFELQSYARNYFLMVTLVRHNIPIGP